MKNHSFMQEKNYKKTSLVVRRLRLIEIIGILIIKFLKNNSTVINE